MAGYKIYSSQPRDDREIVFDAPRLDRRKPIIRVVCPTCGSIVPVNALEVEGSTDTQCNKCKAAIISIGTDDLGRIVSIDGWAEEVEKKAPPTEPTGWKALAPYAVGFVLGILIMAFMFAAGGSRATSSPPAVANRPSTEKASSARQAEEDLSRPTAPVQKDDLPFSGVLNNEKGRAQTNPVTPPATADMFAPAQK